MTSASYCGAPQPSPHSKVLSLVLYFPLPERPGENNEQILFLFQHMHSKDSQQETKEYGIFPVSYITTS